MNQETEVPTRKGVKIFQKCVKCEATFDIDVMLTSCRVCSSKLEYHFDGKYEPAINQGNNSIWKYFDLIPLNNRENIFSLGEGNSDIIEIPELSEFVNGARIFLMTDSEKNPTGIFKDREASIILSRCLEQGLDNLVFYSTANTGRSYTHYAAHLDLTTYLFMPKECHFKNTKHIKKNKNNFIIYVDSNYPKIAPFAKKFAEKNGFNSIAPLQDRNESYATIAYEQVEKLPNCDYFVQTIASGMGPIGFVKGHKNLISLGVSTSAIPKIVCIQSSEMNVMSVAFNSGKTILEQDDMPKGFDTFLYEPTLNSTNPVNNYPELYKCLKETNGIITDVTPTYVDEQASVIIESLKNRGIELRTDLEKSLLIEFAGIVKLAKQGEFAKDEVILMLACGRGRDKSQELYEPDAIINPEDCDVVELKQYLDSLK